jgi:hypothetical protein
MKITGIISAGLLLATALAFSSGCTTKESTPPCDNKGKVCIENKLDSTLTVYISETHNQFDIQKNYMECLELEGNQPYKFTFTGPNHDIRDTTFMVIPCDNMLLTIQ